MILWSDTGNKVVSEDYKWGQFRRILDIGGASGSVLEGLLENSRTTQGIVCDLPQVQMYLHAVNLSI